MFYNPQDLVRQFHDADPQHLEGMSFEEILICRLTLIREEYKETIDALLDYAQHPNDLNLAALAKEIADLHYVLHGTEDVLGIPGKQVFKAVHKSNMSKRIKGAFQKRADGKVLKGPNYKKPNVLKVIFGNR